VGEESGNIGQSQTLPVKILRRGVISGSRGRRGAPPGWGRKEKSQKKMSGKKTCRNHPAAVQGKTETSQGASRKAP